MAFHKGFRTPTQLTGVARGAFDATYEQYAVADLLPVVEDFTLDYTFQVGSSPLPAAAKFRSFNTPSMVNTAGQGRQASGKLPPTSIRMHVDEYHQLKLYRQDGAIAAKFDEYAERNAQSIAFRVVLAAAQAVETGKVEINERGLDFEIDFGRRADLTANAATAWSNTATAKPIQDVEALKLAFGKRVAQTRISAQTMSYLQRNVDLIKIALQRGSDLPSMISQEDVRTVWRDYGLGEIVVDEDVVMDTTGQEVPLFSQNAVLLTTGSQLGQVTVGVTAEAMDPDNGIAEGEAPGLCAGVLASDDPSGFDVLVTGILLPVLTGANNTATLKV